MSREALQESLSAVLDNEADELELRRVLAACGDDAELRATWSRYHLARAVMHGEPVVPTLDIAAAVSAALADESVPEAPRPSPWRIFARLAVAASVTMAVLAGAHLYYGQTEIAGNSLAQQGGNSLPITQAQHPVHGPAVLASYSQNEAPRVITSQGAQSGWHELRLPGYLRQHAQQSPVNSSSSPLPYARAASLESR